MLGTRGAGSAKAFGFTGVTGYLIQQSLRLRKSVLGYLSKTPPVTGSQTTWTMSMWVKLGTISDSTSPALFSNFVASPTYTNEYFGVFYTDSLQIYGRNSSLTTILSLTTSQVLRDPSAWYHLVFVADTTQATAANRFKLYINGIQVTAFSSATYPAQNTALSWNQNRIQYIGIQYNNSGGNLANTQPFDGYLSEVNFIDGQALTANSFGEFNSYGVWSPKKYTGTYGTNGYYLPFSDKTSTTTLGYDFSGNSNNWTPVNISLTPGVTYDSMTDVPTLTSDTAANYCVLNGAAIGADATVSGGNLNIAYGVSGTMLATPATFGMSSGKWYWEFITTVSSVVPAMSLIGITTKSSPNEIGAYPGANASGWGYYANTGQKYTNGSSTAYGATWTTNDVIGVAFDADAGTLTFYKNNTSQGTAYTGLTSGPYFPVFGDGSGGNTYSASVNFGQRPFAYTPPAGYNALNAYNLSTPTISAGNKYMAATTYTGTGTALTVTNAGAFRPDFVWLKSRSNTYNHLSYNSTTGNTKVLYPNLTLAEETNADLTSFNSNGFTLGTGASTNANGATYVGWQWQAGQGSTSTNTSGTITSTVNVNTTSGFSIVTFNNATSGNYTVGHGLNVAPQLIIVKYRNVTSNWFVYHASLGYTQRLFLNTTDAAATASYYTASPSSTVINFSSSFADNPSQPLVAYCWSPVAGFSQFGSYTGNGSADGPFVYTGFRPAFVLIKNTTNATTRYWDILDSTRNPYNVMNARLFSNASDAETTSTTPCDFLSNGFKIRTSDPSENTNGNNYIYACFAENPFKYALAR